MTFSYRPHSIIKLIFTKTLKIYVFGISNPLTYFSESCKIVSRKSTISKIIGKAKHAKIIKIIYICFFCFCKQEVSPISATSELFEKDRDVVAAD